MKKTLQHRIFGWGKIPRRYAPTLHNEGIILLDEGIGGSITFIKFKAPGRYHSWKRRWFTGCIVLTERSFAAFALNRPLIYVPLEHENISELGCSIEESGALLVTYNASAFNEQWSGTIECRFKTPKAQMFRERLSSGL